MAFEDKYRLSAHAVITDAAGRVLLLKANYGDRAWGLPGGGLEPGETVHEALLRECREEIGCAVAIGYLSGVYYHSVLGAHAAIFRCRLHEDAVIQLSDEHSEHRYCELDQLTPIQRVRVDDCLNFDGTARSRRF
ncbi:MAG TPA: NUDIX domain-containing protein [Polyangiaceae bacterium]|nr:NUDIX domain-containing protein [Polyangiaceae bacterium]